MNLRSLYLYNIIDMDTNNKVLHIGVPLNKIVYWAPLLMILFVLYAALFVDLLLKILLFKGFVLCSFELFMIKWLM